MKKFSIKSFVRWLKRLLGLKPAALKLEILEEYHSDDGSVSVFRIRDRSTPGAVDCWKIERHGENVGWFCVAIDLTYLRQDLAGSGLSPAAYLRSAHRSLAGELERQIAQQSGYLATHWWICGCTEAHAGTDSRGRHYRSRRICDLRLVAGDYQGAAASFAGQRYVERVNRQVIDQIANDRFREFNRHNTWKAAVNSIDWAKWHEGILCSKGGISPDHRLQVPIPPKIRQAKKLRTPP